MAVGLLATAYLDRPPAQTTRSAAVTQAQSRPAASTTTTQTVARRPVVPQVAVSALGGRRLGDRVTYADGSMACVLRTSHRDAGHGLARVAIQLKAMSGRLLLYSRTATVRLTFARGSSTARLLSAKPPNLLAGGGSAGIGTWVFLMPADKLGDISVTLAPTIRHQPVTFHGASR